MPVCILSCVPPLGEKKRGRCHQGLYPNQPNDEFLIRMIVGMMGIKILSNFRPKSSRNRQNQAALLWEGVERKVNPQHVHGGFAKDAQERRSDVGLHDDADSLISQPAGQGYAMDL